MSLSLTITNVDRDAEYINFDLNITNTDFYPWTSMQIRYNNVGSQDIHTVNINPALLNKLTSASAVYKVSIPNLLSATEKNNVYITAIGLANSGSSTPVQATASATAAWSTTYLDKTIGIKIIEATRSKTKINVKFRAYNYYADLPGPSAGVSNIWVALTLKAKDTTAQSYSNVKTYLEVKDKIFEAGVDIPVENESSGYSFYITGGLENDGPDNIFETITSVTWTKTSEIDNALNSLASLAITSNSYKKSKSNNEFDVTLTCSVDNTTGRDWKLLHVLYSKSNDPTDTETELTTDLSDGRRVVDITLKNLDSMSTYDFKLKGTILKSDGTTEVTIMSDPVSIELGSLNTPVQSLVRIYNPKTGGWFNITKHVVMPSYNVINGLVEESWDDANYTTHKIAVREKITGSFEILFQDRETYYKFFDHIRLNQNEYGKSYCKLVVQMNNTVNPESIADKDIDPDDPVAEEDLSWVRCRWKSTKFFVKINDVPWYAPWYGVGGKEIEPIKVEIEEA